MAEHGWITVGVDGSDGSRAAVRWAAREANRAGVGLRLVHVFEDYFGMPGFYASVHPLESVEERQVAEKLVRGAAQEAESLMPDGRVEPFVMRGDRRAGLLRAAADSLLVVLGDEDHPARHRLITGSIIGSIAAHSTAPVVVVPANCAETPPQRVVLVGIKFVAASRELLREAFELAADRGARLVVLHAWEPHAPYEQALTARADIAGWEERTTKELRQIVDEIGRDFSNVAVDVQFVHGQPARVLADASAQADLLVITRRLHGFPLGHLGSTGRATLRETQCPALVLPPSVETMPLTAASAE